MIKSSSQGSGDLELMQLRSKCLYNMGDLENAVKHLQMCIRADPENAAIIKTFKFYRKVEEKRLAGNAAFKAQNWQEAITEWNACIELDPRNVGVITKLYYNRGVAYAKVSRFDDSIMDCTRAIRLDNNYAKAYVRRGDSHMSFPGDGPHIEQAIA
jgi:DnaJ homolog subfamily C member 7